MKGRAGVGKSMSYIRPVNQFHSRRGIDMAGLACLHPYSHRKCTKFLPIQNSKKVPKYVKIGLKSLKMRSSRPIVDQNPSKINKIQQI